METISTDANLLGSLKFYKEALDGKVSELLAKKKAKTGSTGCKLADELKANLHFRVLDKLDTDQSLKKALALFDGKAAMDELEAMTFIQANKQIFDDLTPEEQLRN